MRWPGRAPAVTREDNSGCRVLQAQQASEHFKRIHAANRSHPFLSWAVNLGLTSAAFARCMGGAVAARGGRGDGALSALVSPAAITEKGEEEAGGGAAGGAGQSVAHVLHSDPELEAMNVL